MLRIRLLFVIPFFHPNTPSSYTTSQQEDSIEPPDESQDTPGESTDPEDESNVTEDHDISDSERIHESPNTTVSGSEGNKLTFKALRRHEVILIDEPKGMPVPAPVSAEISRQMEEQAPTPVKAEFHSSARKKTAGCNCYAGACTSNPFCHCFLYNEPCDPQRCHPADRTGKMMKQCNRLDKATRGIRGPEVESTSLIRFAFRIPPNQGSGRPKLR